MFGPLKQLESIDVVEKNPFYNSLDGVIYDKDMSSLVRYPIHKSDASFNVPHGVVSIENNSFFDCSVIQSIYLPSTVEEISPGAFLLCTSLLSVDVDPSNPFYSSVDGVLYNKDQTKVIYYPEAKPREQEQVDYETFKEEFSSKSAPLYSFADVNATITHGNDSYSENLRCLPKEMKLDYYEDGEQAVFEMWAFDESVPVRDTKIYEMLNSMVILDIDNYIYVLDRVPDYITISTFYLYPTQITTSLGGGGKSLEGHSYEASNSQTISYGIELLPEEFVYRHVETIDGEVRDTYTIEGTFEYH